MQEKKDFFYLASFGAVFFVASPRAPSVGYICLSFEKAVSGA